ncbi:P-II family nitrogen regulator [Desulfogranum mediterraneum]|uniref:P-II family nitrogen regulator n=1 Tax=Desulfogranum mediterraneum TaxID=160661 RepID=UPI0003F9CD00|nr:P-II family nitrogen regulator [Desulfogranum mediterraneum]
MDFKLIITSVKQEYTDTVVDAAKAAGATGATIIHARGTGIREAKTFFGLSLEAQTDIILFLTAQSCVSKILAAINRAGEFHKPGTGIAFVLPVEQTIGLESQMERFEEEQQSH